VNLCVTTYEKLFKLVLNTIPRPLLIRLSYVARPVLALALKVINLPILLTGKVLKRSCLMAMEQRNNVLSPSTPLEDIVYFGYF
jgi:hypothetical protein